KKRRCRDEAPSGMAPSPVRFWWPAVPAFCRCTLSDLRALLRHLCTRRGLLILVGLFVFLYALAVLLFVQSTPDLGLRTAFSVYLKAAPRKDRYTPSGELTPQAGDKVVRVGELKIETWPKILTAPQRLQERLAGSPPNPVPEFARPWAKIK